MQNHKKWKYVVWLAPGATGSQQQEPTLGFHAFIEAKWTFLVKLVIIAQEDALEGDQAQQQ